MSRTSVRHRTRHTTRRSDQFTVVVQRVILAFGAAGVIYGQAEMLGEPWRHVIAIGGVIGLVLVALWMKVT